MSTETVTQPATPEAGPARALAVAPGSASEVHEQSRGELSLYSYSAKHDAYFCERTQEWKEPKCGDPNCHFCANRPDKPPLPNQLL